ncbi:unnamed protein product [Penicillium olsonii]|nr:unnamed protein product [Penicillium olsonii]CAG7932416.1 unnamed protein product [Penicillium olsonii]
MIRCQNTDADFQPVPPPPPRREPDARASLSAGLGPARAQPPSTPWGCHASPQTTTPAATQGMSSSLRAGKFHLHQFTPSS